MTNDNSEALNVGWVVYEEVGPFEISNSLYEPLKKDLPIYRFKLNESGKHLIGKTYKALSILDKEKVKRLNPPLLQEGELIAIKDDNCAVIPGWILGWAFIDSKYIESEQATDFKTGDISLCDGGYVLPLEETNVC
jgi:hypothetical protein